MKNHQAFPIPATDYHAGCTGMTIRTWMAGQVVASGLCQPDYDDPEPESDYAREVLRVVDAVIEELEK